VRAVVKAVRRVPLEQNYLIFGVVLLALGVLFLCIALRIRYEEGVIGWSGETTEA